MFKIGDFSRLSRVSIKTLRFYDEIGLLKPAHVDEASGYRYYQANQLPRLYRILALKDLGFTLEEIVSALAEGVGVERLREMLQGKRQEIQRRMQEEQERLNRVQARLSQIEQENVTMSGNDVLLKQIEAIQVVSIRQSLPAYSAVGELYPELCAYLSQRNAHPVGPAGVLWHDPEYKETDIDGEAYFPAPAGVAGDERVKAYLLPAVETMACLVHHGSYSQMPQAYDALLKWVAQNGYKVAGANREVYLQCGAPGDQNDASCVTEIQFPVEKA